MNKKYLLDCQYFKGNSPCLYNKMYGAVCFPTAKPCQYYSKASFNILIIKLGAAGDVIRTTPLLYELRNKYKNSHITWVSQYPELVPSNFDHLNGANKVIKWSESSLLFLSNCEFDVIINLDKDEEACSLLKQFKSGAKYGFTLKNNKPYPVNEKALHKYLTGIFDETSKNNLKSYLDEIFEICGFEFNKQEYILPQYLKFDDQYWERSGNFVGLNTGCGERWVSRLWPESYWVELIKELHKLDMNVILLGGPEEDSRNLFLSKTTGAKYFGVLPIKKFIGLMAKCEYIVTSVTMAMHIAIGLKLKIIVLNNIFNSNEFELYNRGLVLNPSKECKCYFQPSCTNNEYRCIEYIKPNDVISAVAKLRNS